MGERKKAKEERRGWIPTRDYFSHDFGFPSFRSWKRNLAISQGSRFPSLACWLSWTLALSYTAVQFAKRLCDESESCEKQAKSSLCLVARAGSARTLLSQHLYSPLETISRRNRTKVRIAQRELTCIEKEKGSNSN